MTSPAPTAPLVKTAVRPPVARLALDCPPLNVIYPAMMDEFSHELANIEPRQDISVIVISGEGKSFSAGVAAQAHTRDNVEVLLTKFHGMIRALVSTKKVTIAAVQGHCLGGGAELAMVCDLVYTADNAQWGFPEIKLGCYPPVACTALAALVGQKRASELIFTGRSITGADAARIGLANRAVPESELAAGVEEAVAHLQKLSPAALAITKKAIYACDSIHFDKGLARAEKIYIDELIKTTDAKEGIRAFMEKRDPQWRGE